MRMALKWTNRVSGESGFVQSVLKSKGHFVNTWDIETAKIYKSENMLNKDLATLEEIGETKDNDFVAVEVV